MNPALFAANLTRLERDFPDIAARVASLDRTLSKPVCEDGRPVDIDLGNGRLYGCDVHDFVNRQMEDYRASARRILLAKVYGAGTQSPVGMRMFEHMRQRANTLGGALRKQPEGRVSFLIVFGLGLGLHLPRLLDELDVQCVVVVEPYAEFIRHSMHSLDWNALLDGCAERGQEFRLLNINDIDAIARALDSILGSEHLPALDGSYVFHHYPSWLFSEVDKRLGEVARQRSIARGYIEDELRMMATASANLSRPRYHLLAPPPRRPRGEVAFVIGSGPSIDRSIEVVKKWREHAIVFSCGTALQVLLSNGIVPDYHCELENGEQVVGVLEHVRSRYSFDGIRLIASATVDPAVPGLFDRTILFLRDAVSPTTILRTQYDYLQGVAPTVSNTATAAALFMGFRQIYLFGVDCGSRQAEVDHSERAPYTTMNLARPTFTMSIPGNFGGTVRTHWVFDLTRHMLGVAQRAFRARIYNCSDGARIQGTVPKVPQAVRLAGPVLDRAAVTAAIDDDMPFFDAPGAYFADFDLDGLLDACDEVERRVRAMLADMRAEDRDMAAVTSRVARTMRGMEPELKVSAIMCASTITLTKIAAFFVTRVPPGEAREEVFRAFLEEYARLVEDMLGMMRESIAGAAATIRAARGDGSPS